MFLKIPIQVTCASLLALVLTASPVLAEGLGGVSHRDKIYDMVIHGDELFAVGFPGLLLHSADRGQSWELLDLGTENALFSIDIADDGKGVIVGRSGLVFTTSDGGKSWAKQNSGTEEHLFDVDIVNGGKAWAAGHFGTIIHSSDAGKSWSPQQYDPTVPTVAGEEGEEAQQVEISIAEMENEGEVGEARLNSVSMVNDREGWIGGEFGLVLHTEDGGQSWKRQVNNSGKLLFSLRAMDAEHVLAVGIEGNLIETRDGGENWKAVDAGVREHLLDVWPLDGKCYVVGRDGVVLVREGDEGDFRRLNLGIFAWLGTVRFLDQKLGFVAGGRGFLLRTGNAGAEWQRLSPEGR
jgi:photosystem II stability/assembly factor-like uncharacterized protein